MFDNYGPPLVTERTEKHYPITFLEKNAYENINFINEIRDNFSFYKWLTTGKFYSAEYIE